MNADEGRMNADKAMNGLRAKLARFRQGHETLFAVYPRSSAFPDFGSRHSLPL
jgi:hypothetical protein